MEKPPPRSPRGDEQGHGVAALDHGELPGGAGAEDGGEGMEKEDGGEATKAGGEAGGDGCLTQPTHLSAEKRPSQGRPGNGLDQGGRLLVDTPVIRFNVPRVVSNEDSLLYITNIAEYTG